MVDRRDIGSWLQGPDAVRTKDVGEYAGQRLGLPEHGPGSLATFGRRLAALVIDWAACMVLAYAFFRVQPGDGGARSFLTLGVFAAENLLLVTSAGATLGHRLMSLRVLGIAGRRVSLVQVLVRTLLLCLFIPAVIWDRDGRGVHDKVPNTMIVKA